MPLTILSVGAHMDDSELGIGGIMIQAAKAGHRVVTVVATSDYTSWHSTVGREQAVKEQQLALAQRFGYEKRFLGYGYHQVLADLEFKRKLAEIYVELWPDITFVHCTDDDWPDHVNCGIAAKDAVLFSHGLSHDLTTRRCPRVFAYAATPGQTYLFEPDFYVDVSDVMPEYMELLQNTDSCLSGRSPEEMLRYEVKDLRDGSTLKVSGHGWSRLSDCVRWGAKSGAHYPYAIGLKTLWGPRDGRALWEPVAASLS